MSKSNYEKYAKTKQQELLHKERNLQQAISCLRDRRKFAFQRQNGEKTMNEEMNRIKDYFKEYRWVSLAKQCKQEYIVYSYFLNNEGTAIVRLNKQHFKNRDLEGGKSKRRKIEIPIEKFFNDTIYDLLMRGYKLEDWN